MIQGSRLTPAQKQLAIRIFTRLGEAEAKVHGTTIEKVHFHEVGAADSIADIVGAAIGLDLLGFDRLEASPIPTGHGFVNIAHGRVSIPAPATAELLSGVPIAPCDIPAELTTPTGAAIVATVADGYGPLPAMTLQTIGYGAGTRDLEQQANLVRLLVGERSQARQDETVWVLETNLDDVSGEVIGHALGCLLDAGALDVYTVPIQMKKNRPGVMLCVLCHEAAREPLERIVFRETGTLGVRRWSAERHVLDRRPHQVETPWGTVAGKLAFGADHRVRFTPEYESCRAIARRHDVALTVIYEAARQAFRPEGEQT
jgi:hypothetical protein